MSNREAFGKGGGSKTFIKDRKLKAPEKGQNMSHFIARIVPPMKSLQGDKKGWARYVRYHYGHKGNGNKPGGTFSRTFACIEEVKFHENKETGEKWREIIKHCPKCDQMKVHEDEYDRLEKLQKEAGGKGKNAEIDKALEAEDAWLFDNSLSVGHKMYVVTPEDEIIRLQLSGRAKKNLDVSVDEWLKKDDIDAMDIDNGVFIDFRRTGYGSDTQDTFALAKRKVDVPGVGKVDVNIPAPLSDEMLGRILDNCIDLTQTETELTYDEIKELVECDQDPDTVDAIFAKAEKRRAGKATVVLAGAEKPAEKPAADPIDKPRVKLEENPRFDEDKANGGQMTSKPNTEGGRTVNGGGSPVNVKPPVKPAVTQSAQDPQSALQAQIAALQAQLAAVTKPAAPSEMPAAGTDQDTFFDDFPENQQ